MCSPVSLPRYKPPQLAFEDDMEMRQDRCRDCWYLQLGLSNPSCKYQQSWHLSCRISASSPKASWGWFRIWVRTPGNTCSGGIQQYKKGAYIKSLLEAISQKNSLSMFGNTLNILNISGLIFCFRPGLIFSNWCWDSPSMADYTSTRRLSNT